MEAGEQVRSPVTAVNDIVICDDGATFKRHAAPGGRHVWGELEPVPGTARALELEP